MTLVDLVTVLATVTGLLASSIGIQAITSSLPLHLRAEGAVCISFGVACLAASSLLQ